MSTVKISELPVLASADAADEFVVVDDSAGVTKKITFDSLATDVRTESEPLTATTVSASGLVTASAGITFGSTTLDDYEEGTWTPEFVSRTGTNPSGLTYVYQTGKYIKVGPVVFIEIALRTSSVSSTGTGFLGITLPFTTVSDSTIGTSTLNIGLTFNWPGESPSAAFINANVNIATLTKYDTTSAVSRLIDVPTSDLGTGSVSPAVLISGFFRTAS